MTKALPFRNQTTLWTSFKRRAVLAADQPALTFQDRHWTYASMAHAIERMAAVLYALGVRRGDRVGYLAFNSPECLFALMAASHLGAIFVPFNFRLTTPELRTLILDSGIHTLLIGGEHLGLIDPIRADLPCRNYLQLEGAANADWLRLLQTELLAATEPAPEADVAPSDIAAFVYTSGTTGVPKAVMLTHSNLWANNLNWILSFGITSDDTLLTNAPMFHVGGTFVLLVPVLISGGHVVLQRAFDAGTVIAAIQQHAITLTFAVPTMMLMLSQHPEFETADLSSLRLVVGGGAPSPEPLLRRYADRGIPVSHCYGQSEVVSACTFLETRSATTKLNSAGRAMPLCEVKLIDADGDTLEEAGQKGEICVRGETVTSGYWQRPEATNQAFTADGWLRSGDLGYFDADGYLYVIDRLKDMIISGGENIYPAEIESVLLEIPAISNAAVIGLPDAQWGERVCAVAVLKQGQPLTFETLVEYCGPRLARYKLPKELKIIEELPLSGAGKVLKQRLRESLCEQRDRP
jgi:fatty-acyl-CoA synthase